MGSLKAKVRLENGFKATALLDISAEINVIIRELMEEANLAMKKRLKLELVPYTSHNRLYRGICENVEVDIRELKTRHPILF